MPWRKIQITYSLVVVASRIPSEITSASWRMWPRDSETQFLPFLRVDPTNSDFNLSEQIKRKKYGRFEAGKR
jgi:hypothetical protein